jgi:alanine dehydrogenase
MKIGLLKEIKSSENRVLLTPEAVKTLVSQGNDVVVESGAGIKSNFADDDYASVGAEVLPSSEKVFQFSELILKVQPPMPIEYELYRPDHISFSFLLLPNNPERMNALIERESIFIASEMIEDEKRNRPVLAAMSAIAGKMAVNFGARYLEKTFGGKGILLAGTEGVKPGVVTIIGGGLSGAMAARHAVACGARVNLLEKDLKRIQVVSDSIKNDKLKLYPYSAEKLNELLPTSDVVISAVAIPGQRAPIVVTRSQINLMEPGSVVIDLSIDQGGSIETARPTTPDNPFYIHDEIIHCCITNIPSTVSATSSTALSNVSLPYISQIARLGFAEAVGFSSALKNGLNLYHGKVVNPVLAEAMGHEYYDIIELFELSI